MLLPARQHTDDVKFHQKDWHHKGVLLTQKHSPTFAIRISPKQNRASVQKSRQSRGKVDQPSLISQGGKRGVKRLSHLCIAIGGTDHSWKWKCKSSLSKPSSVHSYKTVSFSYESTYVVRVSLGASQGHPEIPAVAFVFSDIEREEECSCNINYKQIKFLYQYWYSGHDLYWEMWKSRDNTNAWSSFLSS